MELGWAALCCFTLTSPGGRVGLRGSPQPCQPWAPPSKAHPLTLAVLVSLQS